MTPLSSTRRSTNKASFNTLIVLTLPQSLQWRTTRRMGPSPSWTPLSNQRLMAHCPLLCTGKPTHTDQYLQWDSHHHLSAKFNVVHTLSHRASTVCSKPELLQKEKDYLRNALSKCNYPKWALGKVEKRLNKSTRQATDGGTTSAQPAPNEATNKGHIVIPYTQGLCESIKKICGRYGIQTHFKGGRTIKNLLVSPRTMALWSTKVVPSTGTNVVT